MSIEELKRILPALNKSHIEKELGLKPRILTYLQSERATISDCDITRIFSYLGFSDCESVDNQRTSQTEIVDNNNEFSNCDLFDSVELALYGAKLPFVVQGPLIVFLGDIKYNPVTGNAGTSKEDYAHYESVHDLIVYIREERDRRQIAAFGSVEEEEEVKIAFDVGF